MKTSLAPNGKRGSDGQVMTFGLSEAEHELVRAALPTKGYVLLDTDAPTDLIAIPAAAVIVNASALEPDGRDLIFGYYTELGGCTEETVFWLGDPKPPKDLRGMLRCYETFDQFAARLKYHLLSAHSRSKKARDLSRRLVDCLMILSLIRGHPGIGTGELSDRLEMPTRTVQRDISTLQAAGE